MLGKTIRNVTRSCVTTSYFISCCRLFFIIRTTHGVVNKLQARTKALCVCIKWKESYIVVHTCTMVHAQVQNGSVYRITKPTFASFCEFVSFYVVKQERCYPLSFLRKYLSEGALPVCILKAKSTPKCVIHIYAGRHCIVHDIVIYFSGDVTLRTVMVTFPADDAVLVVMLIHK